MSRLTRHLKNRFDEHVELRGDASRAFRAAVAFGVPLTVCHWLNQPAEAVFISSAALNLSLPDLRGAYRARLGILALFTLIATTSAFLGVLAGQHAIAAVAAMGLVALGGGVWRHLSTDYGPGMAVSSALFFLLGLSQHGHLPDALQLAELIACGGATATFVHSCTWLIRPQHALRYAVAETWVAGSDLAAAMRPTATPDKKARGEATARAERDLRAALDRTFVILGAVKSPKQAPLLAHLEEVRREVVHLTTRIIALNTSLEPILDRPGFARCVPVIDSVLKSLSDAARSAAMTLVMHRAENLAASNVRLRRCQHLIKGLEGQIASVPAGGVAAAEVRAALEQVERVLPRIAEVLGQTTDHAIAPHGFSANLPDIGSLSIRSLGSWIHPAARLDPVLVRHSVRMAVFTMFAVALYKGFDIPRGYWIAFTIMVVLQPDYGSTRQRAAARIAGTTAGIILAGILVWMRMPLWLTDTLAILTAPLFAYFVRRRYGLAIFFVTINLVLVLDTLSLPPRDVMIVRVLATLGGGALALIAARVFWPIWEGEKFPALLAAAVRANRTFLLSMSSWFGMPAVKGADILMAKRRAENANRYVAASVERLLSEPAGHQENPERAAALATYNQRITRVLTVLAVQLPEAGQPNDPVVTTVATQLSAILEILARVFESDCQDSLVNELNTALEMLEGNFAAAHIFAMNDSQLMGSPSGLVWVQLAKMIAELRAVMLALKMTPMSKAEPSRPILAAALK